MGKVVNLRTARKQRARASGRKGSAETAARAGESKAKRRKREAQEALATRRLDGHARGEPEA